MGLREQIHDANGSRSAGDSDKERLSNLEITKKDGKDRASARINEQMLFELRTEAGPRDLTPQILGRRSSVDFI